MDILRPYLLLACTAFTIGFAGYWALGRAVVPLDAPPAESSHGPISTSAPDEPLADAKHI